MYACIDLGSNSFHLLIAEWKKKQVRLIERCSEKVQLGESVEATGVIAPVAFKRGLVCLDHFRELMALHNTEKYWALGTNTFRIAANATDFIEASSGAGIEISVISGAQEAALIYAGVVSALPVSSEKRLVIDIGGGSTEIIVGQKHRRLVTESLPAGCVSWRDRWFADAGGSARLLETQLAEATATAQSQFELVALAINRYDWTTAYASSGTAKMLAAICEAHGFGNNEIQLAALHSLRQRMVSAVHSAAELPGLKHKRRDLVLPGWALMTGLMQACAIDSITFSPTALREGMLDFMMRKRKSIPVGEWGKLPAVQPEG
ncbi:MAG: hypothetical protein WDZ76_10015 [Pseudohongiellaceae bacterium]